MHPVQQQPCDLKELGVAFCEEKFELMRNEL